MSLSTRQRHLPPYRNVRSHRWVRMGFQSQNDINHGPTGKTILRVICEVLGPLYVWPYAGVRFILALLKVTFKINKKRLKKIEID